MMKGPGDDLTPTFIIEPVILRFKTRSLGDGFFLTLSAQCTHWAPPPKGEARKNILGSPCGGAGTAQP